MKKTKKMIRREENKHEWENRRLSSNSLREAN